MAFAHALIKVASKDHAKVLDFYLAALKPLGYQKLFAFGPVVGLGITAPEWLVSASDGPATSNFHVAFAAAGRSQAITFLIGSGKVSDETRCDRPRRC